MVTALNLRVEFSFRSLDGGNVTDADLRGKVAVLIFSDSRLPISKEQAESVRFLIYEFAPRGVIFYLFSTDSATPGSKNYASDEAVREYGRKSGLRLPVLRDPGGKTLREYGRDQIPLVVVLDRQGRVDGKPLEGFSPKGPLERSLRFWAETPSALVFFSRWVTALVYSLKSQD